MSETANTQQQSETANAEPLLSRPGAADLEVRRQAIMKEPDYWKDGPKTQALRSEMANTVGADTTPHDSQNTASVSEQQRLERERGERAKGTGETPSAFEQKRLALTRSLISDKLTDAERARRRWS